MVRAFAATAPKSKLSALEFKFGELRPDDVEIDVQYCGVCHSDLSMLDNAWGMTTFPFVPGHEIVGRIAALGSNVKTRKVDDTVGVGWHAKSCMHCTQCMSGDHNLCATAEQTIVGRHGGFASKVRCSAEWAIPIHAKLDAAKVGPLFCGGITVFNPIVQCNVKPTDRVGVIGIGGLGHLALQFLNKWGCDVTAFTSSAAKREEAQRLGAHRCVDSRSSDEMKKIAGSLDFIISTVDVPLDWDTILGALSPRGRLHLVGAVLEPLPVSAMSLIMQQRSISGSPVGSASTMAKMLDFCGRHKIEPVTELFPLSKVNDAFDHLRAGKARYRIVLQNDLK